MNNAVLIEIAFIKETIISYSVIKMGEQIFQDLNQKHVFSSLSMADQFSSGIRTVY